MNKTELPFIDALLSYPNINITTIDVDAELPEYVKYTPAGNWISERILIKRSGNIRGHMNDFLKAATYGIITIINYKI